MRAVRLIRVRIPRRMARFFSSVQRLSRTVTPWLAGAAAIGAAASIALCVQTVYRNEDMGHRASSFVALSSSLLFGLAAAVAGLLAFDSTRVSLRVVPPRSRRPQACRQRERLPIDLTTPRVPGSASREQPLGREAHRWDGGAPSGLAFRRTLSAAKPQTSPKSTELTPQTTWPVAQPHTPRQANPAANTSMPIQPAWLLALSCSFNGSPPAIATDPVRSSDCTTRRSLRAAQGSTALLDLASSRSYAIADRLRQRGLTE
jgi:hypothetical protein